jgi:predicted NBD/HSP70 family sugar kinase
VTVEPDGHECRCGKRGCLETVASDESILLAIAGTGPRSPTTIAEAVELARSGDEAARAAFARAGEAIGRAVSTLVNLVEPERIVFSGEGVVASDLLMDSLATELRRHAFGSAAEQLEIVTRPLGDETWARGAAVNVLRHLIARPVARTGPVVSQRR